MTARNRDTEATLERTRAEAEERIARMLADAEERSTTMINEARASADRVRAESDRELAAAAQRRDSINAQLSNVRQMLATLTGTVPGVALPGEPEPAAAADAPAAEGTAVEPDAVTEVELEVEGEVVEAQEEAAADAEERSEKE
jgi:hypothetical protein